MTDGEMVNRDLSDLVGLLACPRCHGTLIEQGGGLRCAGTGCGATYPSVGGIPILLDESKSVFTAAGIAASSGGGGSKLKRRLKRLWPSFSLNSVSRGNYRRLAGMLPEGSEVLVIGAGEGGEGISVLRGAGCHLVETDVAPGGRVRVVADAHALPFRDRAFDAAVVQAVLEHVTDPPACAGEIHRVLKAGGLLYSEIPFMQQVHMDAHDFTRFTLGGHRRLLRMFSELGAGAVCGPGMALCWAIHYFFRSFSKNRAYRLAVAYALPFLIFWIKYFDLFLVRRPAALDAASGTFFLGRRAETATPDLEILGRYDRPPRHP